MYIMKKLIPLLLSCIVIAGFFACNKDIVLTPDPLPPALNECYDSTLIRHQGDHPYTKCWVVSDPVCGCDGITYLNGDVARYDHGVINYTKGPCEKKNKHKHKCDKHCKHKTKEDDCHDLDLIGSVEYMLVPNSNPVCGCDGVTYGSPEEAMYTYGVKSYTIGGCKIIEPMPIIDECHGFRTNNMICAQTYDPVCGCDGVEYSNSCQATAAGIKSFVSGQCGTKPPIFVYGWKDCVDSSKINENAICTAEYAPVCACNGVTYSNSCEATAAGVISFVSGQCVATVPRICQEVK